MRLIFHGLCPGVLYGVGVGLKGDVVSELGDLAGEALGFRLGRVLVEVGGAEVLMEGFRP
jgi:hypothetical protein